MYKIKGQRPLIIRRRRPATLLGDRFPSERAGPRLRGCRPRRSRDAPAIGLLLFGWVFHAFGFRHFESYCENILVGIRLCACTRISRKRNSQKKKLLSHEVCECYALTKNRWPNRRPKMPGELAVTPVPQTA